MPVQPRKKTEIIGDLMNWGDQALELLQSKNPKKHDLYEYITVGLSDAIENAKRRGYKMTDEG